MALPFEAFDNLDRRCTQALLSASLSLFHGMRRSRSELSEQLRNTMASLETLCEKEGEKWAADERWANASHRFDAYSRVRDELGYGRVGCLGCENSLSLNPASAPRKSPPGAS